MADLSALGTALAAFKSAKDIAEAMIGLRDTAAFQEKMIEFQSRILDAQTAAFAANDERAALIAKVGALEEHLAALENWATTKERYELKNIAEERGGEGIFAYVLKAGVQPSEEPHKVCANCYEQCQKSILYEEPS